jgi:hypothetical protein
MVSLRPFLLDGTMAMLTTTRSTRRSSVMGGMSGVSLFYEPTRIADTRVSYAGGPAHPLEDGWELLLKIGGQTFGNNTVPTEAGGVICNLTVTNQSAGGYLVAYAPDAPPNPPPPIPNTSSIDFSAGGPPTANTLISRVGPGGQQFPENGLIIHAFVPGGSVDVIVDLIGYLAPL